MFSDCEQNSGLPISGSQILTLSSVSRRLHSAFGFADAIGVQLLPGWSTRQHHCPARTHESFCWVCRAGSASSNTFWPLCRPTAERDSTEVNWDLQSGSKAFDQRGAAKKLEMTTSFPLVRNSFMDGLDLQLAWLPAFLPSFPFSTLPSSLLPTFRPSLSICLCLSLTL